MARADGMPALPGRRRFRPELRATSGLLLSPHLILGLPAVRTDLDDAIRRALDAKTKPPGSLGVVETLAARIARIQGTLAPRLRRCRLTLFAGDHGVACEGVSAYPQAVTRQMVANFLAGGAAANVFARTNGVELAVVDAGVAGAPLDAPGLVLRRIAPGTCNFAVEPAMTRKQYESAFRAGLEIGGGRDTEAGAEARARVEDESGARDEPEAGSAAEARTAGGTGARAEPGDGALVESEAREQDEVGAGTGTEDGTGGGGGTGVDAAAFGEMGIANTSSATLLAHKLTGAPLDALTGRGTGLDDDGLARKRRVLARAAARTSERLAPAAALREYGGFEIVMMAGAMIGAARAGAVVIVDGFIASAAALAAYGLAPALRDYLVFAHRSAEPGHEAVLEALGACPILDLRMRLGEGTGALLAWPILRSAAAMLSEMASFESAGVSGRHE